jgi:dienelactone hydrolase
LPGLALDAARVGSCGMSMGGFTSLAIHSIDPRPRASFAMCPMCGTRSPIPQIKRLQSLLRVDDWKRPVPTFLLTGKADPFVIADDVRELYGRLASPKRLAVLDRVGHVHFADGAEAVHERMRTMYLSGAFPDPEIDAIALGKAMRPFSELSSEANAASTARALCLAHMDANLRDSSEGRAFLDGDLTGSFAARGIDIVP